MIGISGVARVARGRERKRKGLSVEEGGKEKERQTDMMFLCT